MAMLKSLELTDEEKIDAIMPISMPSKPDYPYGMRICLTKAELDKLGVDPDEATVGSYFTMRVYCCITDVSAHEGPHGSDYRIEAQIESAEIEDADEPAEIPYESD